MTAALEQHTVLPPKEQARADLIRMAAALPPRNRRKAKLVGSDGAEMQLPDEVYDVLREVVTALSQGLAISIAPLHAVLTTQQAADMLNISRPTLVKLLENGEIPYERRGRHRRVRLVDLLEYQKRTRRRRRALLDELTRTASEDGSDERISEIIHTR